MEVYAVYSRHISFSFKKVIAIWFGIHGHRPRVHAKRKNVGVGSSQLGYLRPSSAKILSPLAL